jgi:hypothetical protein
MAVKYLLINFILEELFCNIDDFYLCFQESINFNLIENSQRKTKEISRLSLSEVLIVWELKFVIIKEQKEIKYFRD